MSEKGLALKVLVVQRLVAAADEIFVLFEQNVAEYHEELMHSRLQQQTAAVGLCKEEIYPELIKVKQEEDCLTLKISTSVKTEENIPKPSVQKEPDEKNVAEPCEAENTRDSVVEQCEVENTRDSVAEPCEEEPEEDNTHDSVVEQCAEEPGCSVDVHLSSHDKHNSCSDTDNSSDWEPSGKKSTKHKKQKLKAGCKKRAAQKNITKDVQLHSYFRKKHLQHSLSCSICGMKFKYLSTQKRHVRRIHFKERPYTCSVCPKSFFRNYDFLHHMRIHTGEQPYRCSDCGHNFRYKKRLESHRCLQKRSLEEKHTQENDDSAERQEFDPQTVTVSVNCTSEQAKVKQEEGSKPACSLDFNLNNNEQPTGSKLDHLKDCEVIDVRSTESKGHKQKEGHEENSAAKNDKEQTNSVEKDSCPACGMTFMTRYTLMRHIRRIHNKEKNYSCSVCQKSFFRKYEYDIHMVWHTGEHPYSCSLCGKGYWHKKTLKDHHCS